MEVPMLDDKEHAIASKLYSKGFNVLNKDRQERFKELLDYYNNLTGFGETEPNAIMHHSPPLVRDCIAFQNQTIFT